MNIRAFTKRARRVTIALSCGDIPIKVSKGKKFDDPEVMAETIFMSYLNGPYELSYFNFRASDVKARTWEELLPVVLHEVAHAIDGPQESDEFHGDSFARVCHFLAIPHSEYI